MVTGLAVLSWHLLGSTDDKDGIGENEVGTKSISKGLHMVEGQINATTVFSGFTWWEEIATVSLIIVSFIVYKVVKFKCYN